MSTARSIARLDEREEPDSQCFFFPSGGVDDVLTDRLPVVVRIPVGPLGSLKCDPPKGNERRPQKRIR